MQFTSVAYKAGSLQAFWPYGGPLAGPGVLGVLYDSTQATPLPIAQLASNIAKALVLTVTAGTPAAVAAAPTTLTAPAALLSKNNNGRLVFNSKLRDVPVRLRLYPVSTAGVTKFFSTT